MGECETSLDGRGAVERLLDNYQECLELRLSLWFDAKVTVERSAPTTLLATWGNRSATLEFSPRTCRWLLSCGPVRADGSFDRVSKRLRQAFSAPLGEEEGDANTRRG